VAVSFLPHIKKGTKTSTCTILNTMMKKKGI
jgi:hypothetical protein